jgi:VIT1/CCC1 family predicted Fe2+/Mn2+ transporter
MQRWTRWQDWVALVAGGYAILSPIWTDATTKAGWTMIVLGALTVLASASALYRSGDVISEGAHAVLGVLFFVAPWVMGFSGTTAMAWTAWVVGVVTFAVGLWALPVSNRLHHLPAATH